MQMLLLIVTYKGPLYAAGVLELINLCGHPLWIAPYSLELDKSLSQWL